VWDLSYGTFGSNYYTTGYEQTTLWFPENSMKGEYSITGFNGKLTVNIPPDLTLLILRFDLV